MNDKPERSMHKKAGESEVIGALSLALTGTHCGVTIQDSSLAYRHVYNLPQCWSTGDDAHISDKSIFGPHLGEKLNLAKAALMATGERQKLTTHVDGRIISFSMDMMKSADQPAVVVTSILDITLARKREATLRTLLLELSHRSKNLMAIIQALATQTAKYSPSVESFLKAFTARLHAVSGTQDVLVDSNWQGASLFELARRQLVLADADKETNVIFEGEDIELDPNQSLHIGLALHELAMMAATPAEKARGFKKVSLKAIKQTIENKDHVVLQWQSTPGLAASEIKSDFGSVLLEKVVPAAVSGKVEKHQSEDGVNWTLNFPLNIEPSKAVKTPRKKKAPHRGVGDA